MAFKRGITIIAIVLGVLRAQSRPAQPAFEVATVKPAPPITRETAMSGSMHVGVKMDQSRVDIGYTTLAELIRMAYRVKPYQVKGPDWITADKWDIVATLPQGASTNDFPQMLQQLLVERFKLTAHMDTAERTVYALEAANTAGNLKEAIPDEAKTATNGQGDAPSTDSKMQVNNSRDGGSTTVKGAGFGTTKTEMMPDGSMRLQVAAMSMSMLANALAAYLDRPVIDQTKLTGKYQVTLDISPADLRKAAMKAGAMPQAPTAPTGDLGETAPEPPGASMMASVRRMGLKLELRKVPIEVVVVDHLEKNPTAN